MKDILRSRLNEDEDELFKEYTLSPDVDKWIFDADIYVDLAHVIMLGECKIISLEERDKIIKALLEVKDEGIERIEIEDYEDVHVAIESKIIEKLGGVGGKMHTARSRNDEVATCLRFKSREELIDIMQLILDLLRTILNFSRENIDVIMPGYTHMQHAQPVLLSHYYLAHYDVFKRDFDRLSDFYKRLNLSPLGSAAFAGTGFKIDRERTAYMLGFDGLVENSMDAVSTRDFVLEMIFDITLIMINVSRMAEELILWSTSEFNFIELDDSFASTSSIMPQKKNPDSLELMRSRSGSLIGYLTAALSICKAIPFSYNLDNQEVSVHLLMSIQIVKITLKLLNRIIDTLTVHKDVMMEESDKGFTTATELADIITIKTKIPFRVAHSIIGEFAKEYDMYKEFYDIKKITDRLDGISITKIGKKLSDLGLTIEDVENALNPSKNIERRISIGGTSHLEVKKMIEKRETISKNAETEVSGLANRVKERINELLALCNDVGKE
ncbi:MAG TPA: argininosuccinate lyase [Halobacteria archaeon]|jgi:argininosuccinate lyase|nr:argininosuccinate lyase [Halobacteria archaeon]